MNIQYNTNSSPDFYLISEKRSSISGFTREPMPNLQIQNIDEVSNLLLKYSDIPAMKQGVLMREI